MKEMIENWRRPTNSPCVYHVKCRKGGGEVGEGGNRRVSKRKKLGTKPVSIKVLFSLLLSFLLMLVAPVVLLPHVHPD